MGDEVSLEGACSCGRNHYFIICPPNLGTVVSVIYDDRAEHGEPSRLIFAYISNLKLARSLSLRVPLSQMRSSTYAFYPDETHAAIRRVFTPRHAPYSKRHFCGFCGTSLSHWSEETQEEAEWVNVNLGSLMSESVEKLADQGLLEGSEDSQEGIEPTESATLERSRTPKERQVRGVPWFEEMIEGSQLGRIKRKRGGQSSADGSNKVEWEIVEFSSETSDIGNGIGKRKLDQIGKSDDVEMRSG